LLLAVRVYQAFFSALMPSACKFYPSCSQYAADALRLHGARRGMWLALRRLSRCHPFTRGGVDLVPDATHSPGVNKTACPTTIPEKSGDEVHS
jgi:putative membrane protein insertion efficiency factor